MRVDGHTVGTAELLGVLTSLDTSDNVFVGQSAVLSIVYKQHFNCYMANTLILFQITIFTIHHLFRLKNLVQSNWLRVRRTLSSRIVLQTASCLLYTSDAADE